MTRAWDAVLFDLDGTLLDSVGDLAAAANRMLVALGRPELPLARVATYVGKGIPRLVHRALTGHMDADAEPALHARALALFEAAYEEESGRSTTVYPGVVAGLERLRAAGVRLACVTNKSRRFTVDLLEKTALAQRFDALVCGDDTPRKKPDPLPYLLGCERLGVAPGRALVIGDSSNDVAAGRAAGCAVFAVPYGYNEGRPVSTLAADRIVDSIERAAELILTGVRA